MSMMPLGKLFALFSRKAKHENRLKGETLPSSVKKRGFSPSSLGNMGPNKPDFDNEKEDNSLLTSENIVNVEAKGNIFTFTTPNF